MMKDFLVEFINYNGPIVVLLTFFLLGFASKIVACYIYDYELDRIGAIHHIKDGIIADIQIAYIDKQNCGIPVNNTRVFVDNMLNMWKKHGISVARIENIGDMCAYICVAITAFLDMVILTERENLGERFNVMTCVYVYTALAIIFFAVLKLWEKVVSSQYKRNLLSDAVTDYIDNQLCNSNDLESVMVYLTSKEEAELAEEEAELTNEESELMSEETELTSEETELTREETELTSEETELVGRETELASEETTLAAEETELTAKEVKPAVKEVKAAKKEKKRAKETERDTKKEDMNKKRDEEIKKYNKNGRGDTGNGQPDVKQQAQGDTDYNDNMDETKENVITQVLDEYLA